MQKLKTHKLSSVTFDFETQSEVDLKKVGTWKYAKHPSTKILMVAYNYTGVVGETDIWDMTQNKRSLKLMLGLAVTGREFIAHNAFFEYCIWNFVGVTKMGWKPMPLEQLLCSAAIAKYCALPASLEGAALAIDLDVTKDKEGKRLINKFCKPRRAKTGPKFNSPEANVEDWDKFKNYCVIDVDTAVRLVQELPPLPEMERKISTLTDKINSKGIFIDKPAVEAALDLELQIQAKYNVIASDIAGGFFEKVTQREKVLEWCEIEKFPLPDMQALTIRRALVHAGIPPHVKKVLAVRQICGSTAAAKYRTIMARLCDDGRIHELLSYHRARCLLGTTEVLTKKGWVELRKWGGGEIAQYHEMSGEIEFLEAKRFIGPVENTWVHIKNNYMDCKFTLGHGLLTSKRHGCFKPTLLGDIAQSEFERLYVKCSGSLINSTSNLSCDQVRLAVAIQADGNLNNEGVRFGFSKTRKQEALEDILNTLNVPFTRTTREKDPSMVFYHISKKDTTYWMERSKYFGSWLLCLKEKERQTFLDELPYWDGSTHGGKKRYLSSIESNVEWVNIIAHLTNSRVGSNSYGNSIHEDIHETRILKRCGGDSFIISSSQIELVQEDNTTFCAESQTGWFVARSNGKIFISKNTGRFGGMGFQIQNLIRPTLPYGTDYDKVVELILKHSLKKIEKKYKNPMEVLASAIRSMIMAPPGSELVSSDYSAIEARVLLWLAHDEQGLDIFRNGEDIYLYMAADIYKVPMSGLNKKSPERPLGKETVLGCGFGMGKDKFKVNCKDKANIILTIEEAENAVNSYRTKFKKVPQFWRGVEKAAKEAIQQKGLITKFLDVAFKVEGKFLICRLPSGKKLFYLYPKIELKETKYGPKHSITYMGQDSYTRKWVRLDTYGGKLTENITQAEARNLMVHGMLLLDDAGYEMTMSVHDELVAEVDKADTDLVDFERLMTSLPEWATGCPVEAEGWIGKRYRK